MSQLKVTLKSTDVSAQYGEDVVLSTDMKTVQDAISGVAGAIGPENCLKLGGAAAAGTAMYVFAKSIAKNWPWVKETKVQQGNVVEISAKPGKEEKLANLLKKDGLETVVKNEFENLDDNLEGLLGEDDYEKYGDQVLELIKDIRIKSIKSNNATSDLPETLTSARIVQGEYNAEEHGNRYTALDSGKGKAEGVLATEFIGKGGKVGGKRENVSSLAARGFDGAEAAKLMESAHGELIKVKIIGYQLSQTFERGFKPTTTIFEVCQEVKKKEQNSGSLQITRGGEILSENLTMAQAQVEGSTVNWRAEFKE